ncbi:RNA-binding domain-containing protein [Pseudomonas putida]|uniref:RNA-binding domain-containing protein n=1 Tax=Pseudomonas putida TaxID=303 RepID=UPI000BEF6FCD|nr:RNA-binding domain-containing protein [Pseudomonas putida]AYN08465.1 AAA family ATPase [Pseudomonas putida]MDD2022402.1 putative DNA binding domain-containing protein [Pseudomonas putida]PEI08270.1 AAA family ATPase [Pseudomonas putida]
MLIESLDDILLLQESVSVECKLAGGREGKGALPEDFWPTYSAFANTDGGLVILGLREKKGVFTVEGIADAAKVRAELFNNVNNRQKVSVNLLTDADVSEVEVDGKTLLIVEVPRARRHQRPVYLTQNPMAGHTYRRLNEGDRPLPDEEVKRMLAEQVEDSRDDKILRGYSLEDLDRETFRAYRQVFAIRDPGHPWNSAEDQEFLRQIGGWRRDRESGEEGLTQAGLLMFGQMVAIQEALPHYMLDYQERPEAKTEKRWIDRLTLDGKWSGNLYDFYRKVYLKLTSDLKVPFQLEHGERQDETPVHIALREALANVLVHADYSDRASVLVVKRPDMFGFRNPGLMRIPVEVAMHGGEADCRNRTLHKMFRFVGVGEQAGTGIPKIMQGWQSQHWNPPKLHENSNPYNQTLLELRMIDLFPEQVMNGLQSKFGSLFEALAYEERVALAIAACEGTVTHARLRMVTTGHRVDLTRTLQHLTQLGMLESTGGRGAVYHLSGEELPTPEDVFGPSPLEVSISSSILNSSSSALASSSLVLDTSSSDLKRDGDGCLVAEQLALPVIDDLSRISLELRASLELCAAEPRQKKKMDREQLQTVLLQLCQGRYMTLQCLAAIVNRKPEPLRNEYLSKMVRDRSLSLAFPTTPTHEKQAYCTTASLPATSVDPS